MSEYLQSALWVFGVGTVLVAAAAYLFQDYLLYFPSMPPGSRKNLIPPSEFGMHHFWKNVNLKTEDNVSINMWLFTHRNSKELPTILFFHGNAGNISHRLPNIHGLFHQSKCNVAILEYRGFGASDGWPTQVGLMKDAKAALEYLKSNPELDPNKIVLFGRSLGGAVAIHLASSPEHQENIMAVMVENTFTSVLDMIDVVMPALKPFKFIVRNPWKSLDVVEKVSAPILFITGEKDELVPPEMMKRLHSQASSARFKAMLKNPEGRHMDTCMMPNYYALIEEFLERVTSPIEETE